MCDPNEDKNLNQFLSRCAAQLPTVLIHPDVTSCGLDSPRCELTVVTVDFTIGHSHATVISRV